MAGSADGKENDGWCVGRGVSVGLLVVYRTVVGGIKWVLAAAGMVGLADGKWVLAAGMVMTGNGGKHRRKGERPVVCLEKLLSGWRCKGLWWEG